MNDTCVRGFRLGMIIVLLTATACGPLSERQAPLQPGPPTQLSDSEQVAGEIMAYLMEVVLGLAGDPLRRAEWANRGADLPLDFDLVVKRMFGPVPLRAELMVLDTNILGLSEVLYHYDPRLNLFKGEREQASLYPCAELMAMRLFLVHRRNQGNKVRLAAMIRHKGLFASSSRAPLPEELADLDLSLEEFRFLQAVFQSEPAFLRYMAHPFLVSTLKRIGLAEQDSATLAADQMANSRQWACPPPRPLSAPPVTIAILASMNAAFENRGGRVEPSPDYLSLIGQLEQAILNRLALKAGTADHVATLPPPPVFFTPPRPMVVHAENAGRVIEAVCPKAAFVLIVLGKNVYRALHVDPQNDVYPHERRYYLDVDDIRYRQIEEEMDAVVDAILPLLTAAGPSIS